MIANTEEIYRFYWNVVKDTYESDMKAYPDLNANYWEYTMVRKAYDPKVMLVVEGYKADVRFLNFNTYNDRLHYSDLVDKNLPSSIQDVDLMDENDTDYTLYVLPEPTNDAERKAITEFEGKKVIYYNANPTDSDEIKLCLMLRYYLPKGSETGGFPLPRIFAYRLDNREGVVPERTDSEILSLPAVLSKNFIETEKQYFVLAPSNNNQYPNACTSYLYGSNIMKKDEVIMFDFIVPRYAKNMFDTDADMRYWSIAIGAENTEVYLSLADEETIYDEKTRKANYVLAYSNDDNLAKIKEKCSKQGINLLLLDPEKYVNGKVMIFYRNMLRSSNYTKLDDIPPFDIRNYSAINESVLEENNARNFAGEDAPMGVKISSLNFINGSGDR